MSRNCLHVWDQDKHHFCPQWKTKYKLSAKNKCRFFGVLILLKKYHTEFILSLIVMVSEREALRLASLWSQVSGEGISDTAIPLKFLT